VYVGNLPRSANEAALTNLLSNHGKVRDVRIITDHRTGRNLGYAFVEMATASEAKRAIEALDGTSYDGLQITVRTATPNRG
jgi:RNA recognition motif-containing protein